jgi:hypothetical protein
MGYRVLPPSPPLSPKAALDFQPETARLALSFRRRADFSNSICACRATALPERTVDHYAPSPRRWDGVPRSPEYPADHSVRRVRHNGEIKWRGMTRYIRYINEALAGEPIGLEESDEALFIVRYGLVELGSIDPHAGRLRKPTRRAVDLWITLAGYRQLHRRNKRHKHQEQNQKTVTYVSGQNC